MSYTRANAIDDAYQIAEGKYPAPASGTKRDKLTQLAIRYNRRWQTEPGIEWDSLYQKIGLDPATNGGLVTATDTFNLDPSVPINFISQSEQRDANYVRVKDTGGNYIPFKTVKPAELFQYRTSRAVAYLGNGQIQFSQAFQTGDQAVGGTIEVPVIKKLPDLNTDGSAVLIDNPDWLPAIMAAYYVLNDRQLNYLFDDLLAAANELMKGMMQNGQPPATTSTGIDYFASLGNVGDFC